MTTASAAVVGAMYIAGDAVVGDAGAFRGNGYMLLGLEADANIGLVQDVFTPPEPRAECNAEPVA